MLGVIAARSVGTSRLFDKRLSASGRMAVSGIAAAFPDIDYLTFWLDPYRFLTEWHRGITHSFLMLPLWAVLLGITLAVLFRRPAQWLEFTGWSALGLVTHVLSDMVTVFGTQVLAPITDFRVAFGLVFDIDPWISVILGLALFAPIPRDFSPAFARMGLFTVLTYLTAGAFFKTNAVAIGRAQLDVQTHDNVVVQALPQPFSPGHWKLIANRTGYRVAYLDLFSIESIEFVRHLRKYFPALKDYRPSGNINWESVHRIGTGDSKPELEEIIWRHPRMFGFRRFSTFPVLHRIDRGEDATCVWFTDLRYVFPGIGPSFRYGMCQTVGESKWRLYRLLRFSENSRDRLE